MQILSQTFVRIASESRASQYRDAGDKKNQSARNRCAKPLGIELKSSAISHFSTFAAN